MATRNVNMADAIADLIPRLARARTSVTRIGFVTGPPVGLFVPVNIAGAVVQCNYLAHLYPPTGTQVVVLVTADVWLVIGQVADPVFDGRALIAAASATAGQTLTGTQTRLPFGQLDPINNPDAGSLAAPNLVVKVAGTYQITAHTTMHTNEAATVIAHAYINLFINGVQGPEYGQRGSGPYAMNMDVSTVQSLPANTTLWISGWGVNLGANAAFNYAQVSATRIGPQ